MKKIILMSCLISATSLTRAALIAGWNFNQTSGATSTPMSADHGSGSLDFSHLNALTDATISNGSGSPLNEYGSDNAVNALLISSGTGENGKSIIFSVNTSGYQNLVLTYATEASGTGFNTQDWSYSTDGGNTFNSSSALASIGSTYATETINFSAAVNDNSSILIELTLSGATGGSGTAHFDNIQFNAAPIPEPAGWGMASGAGLMGLCGIRFWRRSKKSFQPAN